jgi:hypothetical protein
MSTDRIPLPPRPHGGNGTSLDFESDRKDEYRDVSSNSRERKVTRTVSSFDIIANKLKVVKK